MNPFKELLQLDVYGQNLKQILFSTNGRSIVTNSERGDYFQSEHLEIRDMRTKRPPKWMEASEDARNRYAERSWVQGWDTESGKKRVEYIGHTDVVHHVSFSADGRNLVTAASDGGTRIWDAETGNELQRLFRTEQDVYRAAFSSDGRRVATKSDDDAVRVWNVRNGELLREYIDHHADRSWWGKPDKVTRAQSLLFFEEDRCLCDISASRTPRLVDTANSPLIAEYWNHNGPAANVRFTPDGKRLVSVGGTQELICIDHETGSIVSRASIAHPRLAYREDSLSFFEGGRYAAVISDDYRFDRHQAAVECFDLSDGTEVFEARLEDGKDRQIVVSQVPPGIAAPGKDGFAIWSPNPADRNALHEAWKAEQAKTDSFGEPGRTIANVAAGRIVVSVDKQKSFTFKTANDGNVLATFPSQFPLRDGGYGHYSSIEERPAALLVDLLEYDERRIIIQRVDLKSGVRTTHDFERPTNHSGESNWTQDHQGRLAVSIVARGRSGRPSAQVCDATKGALLLELAHPDIVVDAQFHPFLPQLVTACREGGVRVWDVSRASIALGEKPTVLRAALDHGIGRTSNAERAHLLLRDAPEDLFESVMRALPSEMLATMATVEAPRAHVACYAPAENEQRPAGSWSPFIEHRRQQALPDPSFDDRTANCDPKAFRHTTVFRLANQLTKAALANHLSTAGLSAAASETGDEDRLARVDEVLHEAVGLATDLHYYVKPRGKRGNEREHSYRDLLAYDLEGSHRGIKSEVADSATQEFDRTGLEDVARRYIQSRYRSDEFDVALARALTGLEMYQYANSIRLEKQEGITTFTMVMLYLGIALAMLTAIGALGFGLRYAIIAAYEAGWLGTWAGSLADILAGAFALLAVQTLWSIPVSIAQKLFGKPSGHKILQKMYHAYSEIPENAPLSPARLRELLRDSAGIGAVWPASLYRLLDDMEQRMVLRSLA